MLLSIDAPLVDRVRYDFAQVDPELIHDALLDLGEYRAVADTPEELAEKMEALDAWENCRVDGTFITDPDHLELVTAEYVNFFNDCVSTCEEYYGSFFGTARAYSFHEHIANEFEKRDEYQTALINIRQAIVDGESLDYIKSLLPDNLGD